MRQNRAVAPVIATLLLVAIAVVGGSIIFVFSQGFFSSNQISGQPVIESLDIQLSYTILTKQVIAIIQNQSVNPVLITEMSFDDESLYDFQDGFLMIPSENWKLSSEGLEISEGGIATILFVFEPVRNDTQFKLMTSNDSVFVNELKLNPEQIKALDDYKPKTFFVGNVEYTEDGIRIIKPTSNANEDENIMAFIERRINEEKLKGAEQILVKKQSSEWINCATVNLDEYCDVLTGTYSIDWDESVIFSDEFIFQYESLVESQLGNYDYWITYDEGFVMVNWLIK